MAVSIRIKAFIRSNVVGFIALFVALGGVAVAGNNTAPRNSVVSKSIKNGQVKRRDIGRRAINSAKVADGSLTGADVADDSLTGADVNESTLSLNLPSTLPPSGPAGGDLAGSSYPDPTVAGGAVDSGKVADNSLTGTDVDESTIQTGGDLTGNLTNAQVRNNAIGNNETSVNAEDAIIDGSVDAQDLANHSITAVDVSGEIPETGQARAQPAGITNYQTLVTGGNLNTAGDSFNVTSDFSVHRPTGDAIQVCNDDVTFARPIGYNVNNGADTLATLAHNSCTPQVALTSGQTFRAITDEGEFEAIHAPDGIYVWGVGR